LLRPVQQQVQLGQLTHAPGEGGYARRKLLRDPAGRPARPAPLLHPVPSGGQGSLLGRVGAEQPDQHVEPVGRGEGPAVQVLRDRPVRVSGPAGQFPDGERAAAVVAGVPAAQPPEQPAELVERLYPVSRRQLGPFPIGRP
jgi:hypothetical protein